MWVENNNTYPEVNNIDEAIIIFKNIELDIIIDKAVSNISIIGKGNNAKDLSANEILEASVFGINSGVQLLQMYNHLGEIS